LDVSGARKTMRHAHDSGADLLRVIMVISLERETEKV
jgi:hypothetical protein